MRVIDWIKKNKLASLLLLILLVSFSNKYFLNYFLQISQSSVQREFIGSSPPKSMNIGQPAQPEYDYPVSAGMEPVREYPPSTDIKDRMVIQESYLSLLVKNVRETIDKIVQHAESFNGYMVNSSLNNPGELSSGSVTIRVTAKNLQTALAYFRDLSIRVVSENLHGRDVTDQYVDLGERLATLNKTKAKFQEIMDRATEISDILKIQKELINLQSQIDGVKGQQQYLEKSAELAKITIYLSTDELSLPYSPSEPWRPSVIAKLAIRSLIANLRSVSTIAIWIAVYSVIWIPVLLILFFIRKKYFKSNK